MELDPRIIQMSDGRHIDRFTGEKIDVGPPPSKRFRYVVGERGFWIAQRPFKPGEVLGEGNVVLGFPDVHRCEFVPAKAYEGPDPIAAGHIYARLQAGVVLAEPLSD